MEKNSKDFTDTGILEEIISAPAPKASAPKAQTEPAKKKPTARLNTRSASEEEKRRMEIQAAKNMEYAKNRLGRRERPVIASEIRSRRQQLLLKPSIWEGLQALADREGKSFNQMAERAFTEYIQNHRNDGE